MDSNSTILITGAAGFIASCMTSFLNKQGFENLYIVDDFSIEKKEVNYKHCKFIAQIYREHIEHFFLHKHHLDYLIHF